MCKTRNRKEEALPTLSFPPSSSLLLPCSASTRGARQATRNHVRPPLPAPPPSRSAASHKTSRAVKPSQHQSFRPRSRCRSTRAHPHTRRAQRPSRRTGHRAPTSLFWRPRLLLLDLVLAFPVWPDSPGAFPLARTAGGHGVAFRTARFVLVSLRAHPARSVCGRVLSASPCLRVAGQRTRPHQAHGWSYVGHLLKRVSPSRARAARCSPSVECWLRFHHADVSFWRNRGRRLLLASGVGRLCVAFHKVRTK